MKILKYLIENGNVKRIVLILSISALFAISGWMFTQVRDLPACYVMKKELAIVKQEVKSDRIELYSMLNKRLDRLDFSMFRLEDRMNDIILKLVEINKQKDTESGQ